jgi:hypothetical protein
MIGWKLFLNLFLADDYLSENGFKGGASAFDIYNWGGNQRIDWDLIFSK